jgi:hypothetical protein
MKITLPTPARGLQGSCYTGARGGGRRKRDRASKATRPVNETQRIAFCRQLKTTRGGCRGRASAMNTGASCAMGCGLCHMWCPKKIYSRWGRGVLRVRVLRMAKLVNSPFSRRGHPPPQPALWSRTVRRLPRPAGANEAATAAAAAAAATSLLVATALAVTAESGVGASVYAAPYGGCECGC